MTSDYSTFPFDAEQCAKFIELINVERMLPEIWVTKSRLTPFSILAKALENTYLTCVIGRLWALVCRYHYIYSLRLSINASTNTSPSQVRSLLRSGIRSVEQGSDTSWSTSWNKDDHNESSFFVTSEFSTGVEDGVWCTPNRQLDLCHSLEKIHYHFEGAMERISYDGEFSSRLLASVIISDYCFMGSVLVSSCENDVSFSHTSLTR